jgi:hypothetical protein
MIFFITIARKKMHTCKQCHCAEKGLIGVEKGLIGVAALKMMNLTKRLKLNVYYASKIMALVNQIYFI